MQLLDVHGPSMEEGETISGNWHRAYLQSHAQLAQGFFQEILSPA